MGDIRDLKQEVLDAIRLLWESDQLKLIDTERSRRLRPEILKALLSLVQTDDERASLYGLPTGSRMREGAKIMFPDKLTCGKCVWIGEGAIVDASGGLEIGSHTTIASHVFVWTHSSVYSNLNLNNHSDNKYIIRKSTKIGSGVFIGGPSVVYPGVSIGDKSVVLPMSVVTKDVPPYSVVAGSPARVVRELTEESIEAETQNVLAGIGVDITK
jgi:acetyltransferase-like isoleucine patch superfamily enzyme